MSKSLSRIILLSCFALVLAASMVPAEAWETFCWGCYTSSPNGNAYCDPYPFNNVGATECWAYGGNCTTNGDCSNNLTISR